MPQGDRTGPQGGGPKTGKGLGQCNTNTKGVPAATRNQRGMGSGRGEGRGKGRGRSGGSSRGR